MSESHKGSSATLRRAYYYGEHGGWRGPQVDEDERWSAVADVAEKMVAAERERFIDALAFACIAAEIPDSKYESLLIALRA